MKKYLKVIVYFASFVILIIIAAVLYNFLIKKYKPDELQIENKVKSLSKADDFEVLNINGQKVNLSDFFGKPIVVNFWATWCGPCRGELPEFEEAYKKYSQDIEFLMVNLTDGYSETLDKVKEFIKENNYDFPVYFDTKYSAANTYNLYSIPQTLFIDKDGNILESYIGMMNKKTLERYINKLKEE